MSPDVYRLIILQEQASIGGRMRLLYKAIAYNIFPTRRLSSDISFVAEAVRTNTRIFMKLLMKDGINLWGIAKIS